MATQLTVVIPCKDEGDNIIECVRQLLKQTVDLYIIIADASVEKQSQLSILKKNHKQVSVIRGGTPSVGRNRGFDMVKTEYVLFLDADMQIRDHKILEKCLAYAKKYDLVSCDYSSYDGKYEYVWKIYKLIQKVLRKPIVLGGFQLWKSETFKKLGKFNESVIVGEDWLLSKKLRKKDVIVLPDKVYTSSRRFQKKGVLFMIRFVILAYINSKNIDWFKTHHNYW